MTISERILQHMKEHGEDTFTGRQLAEALKIKSISSYMAKLKQVGAIKMAAKTPGSPEMIYKYHHKPRDMKLWRGHGTTQKPRSRHVKPGHAANGAASVKLAISVGGYDISMTFAEANELFRQLQSLFNVTSP